MGFLLFCIIVVGAIIANVSNLNGKVILEKSKTVTAFLHF